MKGVSGKTKSGRNKVIEVLWCQAKNSLRKDR